MHMSIVLVCVVMLMKTWVSRNIIIIIIVIITEQSALLVCSGAQDYMCRITVMIKVQF